MLGVRRKSTSRRISARAVVSPRARVRRASATVLAYVNPVSVGESVEFGATVGVDIINAVVHLDTLRRANVLTDMSVACIFAFTVRPFG